MRGHWAAIGVDAGDVNGDTLVLGGAGGWYWIAAYALSQPYRLAMPNVSSNVVMVILAYSLIRFTGLGIAGAATLYLHKVVSAEWFSGWGAWRRTPWAPAWFLSSGQYTKWCV